MSLISGLKEIQSQLQLAGTVQRIDSFKTVHSMSVQIGLINGNWKVLVSFIWGGSWYWRLKAPMEGHVIPSSLRFRQI